MKLLLDVRTVEADSAEVDELVAALAVANTIVAQYGLLFMPAPDWLLEKVEMLTREIRAKRRDMLALRLKQAKLKRDRLKTPTEQKADLDTEIADLEKQLA